MVKADLVETVCRTVGLPEKESQTAVEMVLGIINETLERGENVKISCFGHFVIRHKKARRILSDLSSSPLCARFHPDRIAL